MKLDNKSNVILCQKALYAKELVYYANLCSIYNELAKEAIRKHNFKDQPNKSISEQVKSYYGPFLSKASNGDFSFLEDSKNKITTPNYVGARFNDKQKNLIKKFGAYSKKFLEFKDASNLLAEATFVEDKNGLHFDIDNNMLNKYYDYMQTTSVDTKAFDDFIYENPSIWIGNTFYKKTIVAKNKIDEIDPEHIKAMTTFNINLKPEAFAASIKGHRGYVRKFPNKKILMDEINEVQSSYDSEEKKEPSTLSRISRNAKVISNRASKTLYASKGSLKKALKKAGIISATIAAIATITYTGVALDNALKIDNVKPNITTVSNSTQDLLSKIDSDLNKFDSSDVDPTYEELSKIRSDLDLVISKVVEDKTKSAIEKKYPDYTVESVNNFYDLNLGKSIPSDTIIYAQAINKNGEKINFEFNKFPYAWKIGNWDINPIQRSFNNEENLDGSPVMRNNVIDLLNKLSTYNEQPLSEKERKETIKKLMDIYKKIQNNTKQLTGLDFELNSKDNGITVKVPSKESEKNDSEKNNLVDNQKTNSDNDENQK